MFTQKDSALLRLKRYFQIAFHFIYAVMCLTIYVKVIL